jgi:hypothetical protein
MSQSTICLKPAKTARRSIGRCSAAFLQVPVAKRFSSLALFLR